ncbi:uncharacterized protein (DUF2235 family) [Bradyrhizobium sp. CIR48]|uniref:T6SS phospholipase effector Tle1-like catalytic domain-containing protein n=1 Tax=Bradyrhizobium sp. CIR48 TaxID=2663840 RepID=UPI00160567C9|nr:DUF2235 domain-containing protein [Bradyrhizobium sp. CIR48]MBB4427099.1 uncharacterized protein (DUF2235 family) [Bradyrhizobium sp. CIR48]
MSKTMILLMDGTTNDATCELFSNVYAINQLIADSKRPRDEPPRTQVTFYLPGVGTKFTVKRVVNRKRWFGRTDTVRQQIFGDDLEQLILRAYVNLCANFHLGDEIAIIGFSRGAAAARILSRFISDLGILTPDMLMFLDRLWNEFVDISTAENEREYFSQIAELKAELRQQAQKVVFQKISESDDETPTIKFLGLFDTVIGTYDEDLCKNINFRDQFPAKSVQHAVHLLSMHDVRKEFELKRFDIPNNPPETFREIWMPGVHADVGGGYSDDFISSVSLLTMADFLKELGGVALIKSNYEDIRKKVCRRIAEQKFIINKEPRVIRRSSRISFIKQNDEVHPLHGFLIGKNVQWKDSSEQVAYQDTISKIPLQVDASLQGRFDKWIVD